VLLVLKGSERVLILKMILLNVLTVYTAPHSEKPEEEKESFMEQIVPFGELCTSE